MGNKKILSTDLKYDLYEASVQCVETDIEFINKEYKRLFKKSPKLLREDFCGTGKLACEWAKQSPKHQSIGLDLDPEPLKLGKKRHYSKLTDSQKERVQYLKKNVMNSKEVKAEIIVAFNFSYWIFKERAVLLKYFKTVRKSLKGKGVFFLDLFGGTEAQTLVEEETEYDNHSYFWDLDKYDPITNECLYKIHFKHKGVKYRDVFTYDWRHWSLPELRDLLAEAGFGQVIPYWEGDGEDGDGDGEFYPTKSEENCESWVTYLAALK